MNIFEYMRDLFKEALDDALNEMPLLSLDMDKDSWEELLKEDE